MKILILGGNNFFGKKLAKRFIEKGYDLTLLNRGNKDDGFGDQVKRIVCDRTNIKALEKALIGSIWDVVYDQICFDYEQAEITCSIFKDKTKKLIFTSSQSVYSPGKNLSESSFCPSEHDIKKIETMNTNYGEAKRQAEVSFTKNATFPVTFVRFPIVIGKDDYTKRFQFHIDKIKSDEPIYFPNIKANISFVTSDFAAIALDFLNTIDFHGPINVASPSPICLKDFVETIENKVGKKMKVSKAPTKDNHSPYGIEQDWYMNCSKLQSLGLEASPITEWLPTFIE